MKMNQRWWWIIEEEKLLMNKNHRIREIIIFCNPWFFIIIRWKKLFAHMSRELISTDDLNWFLWHQYLASRLNDRFAWIDKCYTIKYIYLKFTFKSRKINDCFMIFLEGWKIKKIIWRERRRYYAEVVGSSPTGGIFLLYFFFFIFKYEKAFSNFK